MSQQTSAAGPESDYAVPQLLRLRAVLRFTGLARSTVYRMVAERAFPAPVQLGKRAVAWRLDDVRRWTLERPTTLGSRHREGQRHDGPRELSNGSVAAGRHPSERAGGLSGMNGTLQTVEGPPHKACLPHNRAMRFGPKPSTGAPATSQEDRDFAEAVKRSDTGQLSVSIDDLSKTKSFKRDLDALRRIRERSETPASGR